MFHPDIPLVEKRIKEFLEEASGNEIIYASLIYSLDAGGKRVRPSLTLLCAELLKGDVKNNAFGSDSIGDNTADMIWDKIISSAACVELMHTASLIIDDVVDNSDTRRGKPSVNAVFGNKVAVISASFLLGVISYRLAEIGNIELIRRFSETAKEMAKGEILEFHIMIDNLDSPSQREEILKNYFDVIRMKTACLFSLSSSIPPVLYSGDGIKEFYDFGSKVGFIFQLKDDILDFVSDKTGKPPLKDVSEGKITLPVLLSDNFERIFYLMKKNISKGEIPYDICYEVKELVESGRGIERAENKLNEIRKEIMEIIDKIPSYQSEENREKLKNFVNFISSRDF